MSNVKISIQAIDRKTLISLVKAERRAITITGEHKVNTSQKRAIDFYDDHLEKVQKKLQPNVKWVTKY